MRLKKAGQFMFEELEKQVIDWAVEKHIDIATNWKPQFSKMQEELYEFKDELMFTDFDESRRSVSSDHRKREMMEMGDIVVTLIIMAKQRGYDINSCLEMATEKIKNRTGRKINGVFVKDESWRE